MKFLIFAMMMLAGGAAVAQPISSGTATSIAPGANLSSGNVTATGGTTARATAAWTGDTYNALGAGLKCDGSTDDYPALLALMTTLGSHPGATVYFPAAAGGLTCMMSHAVAIPANITLRADPGTVTIKPTSGNTSSPVLFSMGSGSTIYGLTIDGGGTSFANTNNVVQLFSVSNAVADTVTFQNTRGIAFLASTSVVNSGVRNSSFINIGNYWTVSGLTADRQQAVAFCCGTATANHGNFVTESYFQNIGLDAISATAQADFLVTNNRFDLANGEITATWTNPQPTAFGAAIYGSGGNLQFTANDNLILGAQGNAIDVAAGNATITGNYISGSGQAGIGFFGPGATSTGTVTGNTTINNYQWSPSTFKGGITFSGAYGLVSVSGNVSTDTQGTKTQAYGLQVVSGSSFTDFRVSPDNSFVGNLTASFGGAIADYSFGATSDNRIVNPCFAIDSPNEGANYSAGGGARKIMEGWTAQQSQNMGTTARSTAVSFPGCGSTGLLTTVTNSYTPAAGDIIYDGANIEGVDLQDLNYGTANAQSVVLDFCAQSSVSGNFVASFLHVLGGTNKTYLIPYALTANVQQCFSFVIPGDTATATTNDTTYRGLVTFDLGTGSTFQNATTGSWLSGYYATTPSATVFASQTNGSTFRISSVRLFKGSADVGWTPRLPAQEYALTQRRYRKTFPVGTAVAQNAGVAGSICTKNPIAAGDPSSMWSWGAPMRAAPTITTYNPSAANANWRDVTAAADSTVSVDPATALSNSATGILLATSGTVATLGDILCIQATADAR